MSSRSFDEWYSTPLGYITGSSFSHIIFKRTASIVLAKGKDEKEKKGEHFGSNEVTSIITFEISNRIF